MTLAEHLLADGDDDAAPDPGPRITEFGPEPRLLTAIYNRLGEVIQAVAAAGQLTVPKVHTLPSPRTALEVAEQRRVDRAFDDLMEQIESARAAARQGPPGARSS